jgi:streptogrisin C
MIRARARAVTVAAVAAALLAATAATAITAGASGDPANDRGAPLAAAVRAYQTVYPRLPLAAARRAAAGQQARKSLYAALARDARSFGGAWFDPPRGVLHVAVTTSAASARVAALARRLHVQVAPQRVHRSFAELERQAAALRAGGGALGQAAHGQVGVDVQRNQVVVALPTSANGFAGLVAGAARAGVRLVADPSLRTQADAGCTSRAACDWTIRAGAMLWTGSAGNNVCLVGFTARDASNQRYVYTAGHCSGGNGITWGTGALAIGPMQAAVNFGSLDASIIRVTNPWFASDSGGEIYNEYAPGRSVAVNGVAPTLSYIWAGDTVCLAANYTSPNGPSYCGVVGTNSDAAVRGLVRVDGLDACPGDSGGGWYWLTSSSRRIAYGLHSRSDVGCHGDQGGSHSWFSALPTIKSNFTPTLNVETR